MIDVLGKVGPPNTSPTAAVVGELFDAIVGTGPTDGAVVGVGRVGDVVADTVDVVVLGKTVVMDSGLGAVVMGGV